MSNTVAKVTIQMVDVTAPFVNTSVIEIDNIPMDSNVHQNLVTFLLEAKNKKTEPQPENNNPIYTGE